MKRALRLLSRISIRLLAFNLLLVFLPLAGVLYLGTYESRLETAEVRSMAEQSRILAAVLGDEGLADSARIQRLLLTTRTPGLGSRHEEVRFRLIDPAGRVLADSRPHAPSPREVEKTVAIRHNPLYRAGAFLVRPFLRLVTAPEPPLERDFYDRSARLLGTEVRQALRGRSALDKKITAGGQRSVTLYRATPIISNGRVLGALLASQSTFTILQDLYVVRFGVLRIFVASIAVAFVLSLFFSATIVRPLRQLRVDARSILDRRGRVRGHFKGSKRLDEIGELSRALERITRRLDSHLKSIESFASDVSHEFKNPLASIRTATEMLYEVEDGSERQRFLKMVQQEIARMETLLSGVREISLIDARLGNEKLSLIPISELISRILDGFRLREGDRVTFSLNAPPETLIVEGSEDRLIQVFENILDNAVSFSPIRGTIQIDVQPDRTFALVRIADEGEGISEQHIGRIFDRFFTYRPASDQPRMRHTGLGLAIVKSIVEGYGGSIAASNSQKGALFEIRLPLASAK